MQYFSTGTIQRQIASQMGIDTLELNKRCRTRLPRRQENERFKLFYGADCSNKANFDFVYDTSDSTVDEIADAIIEAFNKR